MKAADVEEVAEKQAQPVDPEGSKRESEKADVNGDPGLQPDHVDPADHRNQEEKEAARHSPH